MIKITNILFILSITFATNSAAFGAQKTIQLSEEISIDVCRIAEISINKLREMINQFPHIIELTIMEDENAYLVVSKFSFPHLLSIRKTRFTAEELQKFLPKE